MLSLHTHANRELKVLIDNTQPPGVSSVPTFVGGTNSADLWLMQLKSYFHLAPNLDSNAKKIFFCLYAYDGSSLDVVPILAWGRGAWGPSEPVCPNFL